MVKTKEHDKYKDKRIITSYNGTDTRLDLSEMTDVISVDRKAFFGCKNLVEIILPESIEDVGDWAFYKCVNLKRVYIGTTISDKTIWRKNVFDGCDRLEKVVFSGMPENYSILYAMTKTCLNCDYLFRADNIFTREWFEIFDVKLLSCLREPIEGAIDVSPDSIGTIDGEMPGMSADEMDRLCKDKCFTAFNRLMIDDWASVATIDEITTYLADRRYGTDSPYTMSCLLDYAGDNLNYYESYFAICKHTLRELEEIMVMLPESMVRVKAYILKLINDNKCETEGAFFAILDL